MCKKYCTTIILFATTLLSCNKINPGGFWESYNKNFIIENISDNGLWGGHRTIFWKRSESNIFNVKETLSFANRNGWRLVDSTEFDAIQTSRWVIYDNKPVFPLTNFGFTDSVIQSKQLDHFPRRFDGPVVIYKFKTGFVIIDPETNESIEDNGFLMINKSRTSMAVYHLWGE